MKKIIAFLIITAAVVVSAVAVGTVIAGKDKCTTIQDGTITYGRVSDPSTDIIPIGYDQWGYNYQAHMFNGKWCDYHPVYRPGGANHDWCLENMADVELMMKWSDEWLSNKNCNDDSKLDRGYSCDPDNASNSGCPGAWLTNHERGTYVNDNGETCSYNYFCKIVAAPKDAHTQYHVGGDWILEFDYQGGKYVHDMTVDDFLDGTGAYPSGGPYSITWTIDGDVDGNNIEMVISYDGSSYEVKAIGTIVSGLMNGTWESNAGQSGTWKSTSGEAVNYWYTADGTEIGPVIWGAFATIQEVENDSCAGLHGLQYRSPASPGFGVY